MGSSDVERLVEIVRSAEVDLKVDDVDVAHRIAKDPHPPRRKPWSLFVKFKYRGAREKLDSQC